MNKSILAVGIVILFLGTCITTTVAHDTIEQAPMPTYKGKTLYVGGTGEGNYTTIQDAINDSNHYDTVFVFNNSSPYYENVVIDKSIKLIGEDRETTVIDGMEQKFVIEVLTNHVHISGFTIRNAGKEVYGTGIAIKQFEYENNNLNNNYITNNIISNNYGGIRFFHSNRNRVINNIITNNRNGISIGQSNFHIIQGNTISNNSRGISTKYSFGSIISKNNITSNKEYGFYITQYGGNFIIKNNIIDNNIDAYFEQVAIRNRWKQNYWNESRTFPKIIFGKLIIIGNSMPIMELIVIGIDWRPAKEPYDIK